MRGASELPSRRPCRHGWARTRAHALVRYAGGSAADCFGPCTNHRHRRPGDTLVIEGGSTVKFTPLLVPPKTVTTTLPVVAPLGTFIVMLLALQLVAVPALVPLNVTVLLPCVAPKLTPPMVTAVPICPEAGF